MTIPSRPAPPPPQQQLQRGTGNATQIPTKLPPPSTGPWKAQSRYCKLPSSDASNTNQQQANNGIVRYKKVPPPRPPPPRINPISAQGDTVLKKPGPPQSVNVLSNIFGKKRVNSVRKVSSPNKLPPPPLQLVKKSQPHRYASTQAPSEGDVQLISFDSPPSSPTFTQKSNSDCVSIDSFSSDSNFSSPNNGSASQPESGFEDDFASPPDPWEAVANDPFGDNTKQIIKELKVTQPVRNLYAISSTKPDDTLCNGKSLLPPPPALSMPTIIKPKPMPRTISPVFSGYGRLPLAQPQPVQRSLRNEYPPEHLDDSLPSPPMPDCPPPPPPVKSSILDVINGKLDAMDLVNDTEIEEPSYGIALFSFEGVESGDLSFRENEKVYLLQRLNDEWYLGRNRTGCEGMFPANYIEVKVQLKEESQVPKQSTFIGASNQQNASHKVRALYQFVPEAPEDLALNVNDMVTVLYRINDDWIYGEVDTRRGQFPANFIEYVPQNLSQKSC